MFSSTNRYKHIYFDLDRTIWDFEKNALDTFKDIYEKYNLENIFETFYNFYNTYLKHNEDLWAKYRNGEIEKEELSLMRFVLTLEEFGVNNRELAKNIASDYLTISPTKKQLFPHAIETLDYLHKKYQLHIITNGFNEVQYSKIKNNKLDKYFTHVITSEDAGVKKPHPGIFDYALNNAHALKNESLMVGDDFEGDVLGAKNFGLDQVYFNPDDKCYREDITHEIKSLRELKEIL